MAPYSKRRSRPALLFHTKKDRDFGIGGNMAITKFPMKDIIKIMTNNEMGAASGTFSIELVYYKIRPGDVDSYYYETVRPLDLVEIELEAGTTTMIGIIDKVQKSTAVGGTSVQRSVQITGRSLGAIWEFDLIQYFTNALGLSADLAHRNLLLQQGQILLDFAEKPPYQAIIEIFVTLPMFTMTLSGGKTIEDFLDVGSELFVRINEKIFARGISAYSGSVWDYFKTYIQEPLNELWTESKDGKLYLRCRPTPFSHGLKDPEKSESALGETRFASWHDIKNWIDDEPFHVINPSDLKDEQLARAHGNAYSVFTVTSSDKFTGADSEYATFHPLVDSELVAEIGTRPLQVSLNYIPIVGDGETTDGSLERYQYYRNKLYLWNRDNHRMESGTMVIKGNPSIRVGDKVFRPDLESQFYVQGVTNNWAYGKPFTTLITVDRGLTNTDRNDLYQAGLDFLKGI